MEIMNQISYFNNIYIYLDGTVKIRFDHSKPKLPHLLKYNNSRHSFSGSSSTSKRDQGINEYLNQLNLNKQKDLEQKDIKQKGVREENPQVNSIYYSVDNQHNRNIESDNESLNPTPSNMDVEFPEEWELIHEMPPALLPLTQMAKTENLNSIEQYLDGTVKIRFDHSKPKLPPLLKYNNSRHSFSRSSISKRDQGINEHHNQSNLNKQKDLEQKNIKQKSVKEENPPVNSVYYSVDNQHNMISL
jgi:hypothetical protein